MSKRPFRFREHPERAQLLGEAHRFSYEPIQVPMRIVCFVCERRHAEQEQAHLDKLAQQLGMTLRWQEDVARIETEHWRLVVQRHVETTRYLFFVPITHRSIAEAFADDPLQGLPQQWCEALPGGVLVASVFVCLPAARLTDEHILRHARMLFPQGAAGSFVGRTRGAVLTDFRLHDGFTRWLVLVRSRAPMQIGRMAGRIIDVECYRTLALMGLPMARALIAEIPEIEKRLEEVAQMLAERRQSTQTMLEELLQLGVEIERRFARSDHRFAASQAYFDVLMRRLTELAEEPLETLPTIKAFLMRRMEGARETIDSIERRLHQLSTRISAVAQLLRTEVNVQQEAQTQKLLAAMERRQRLQLRLQQAADLLSVAIFTYYSTHLAADVVELIAHLFGREVTPLVVRGLSAPLFAAGAIFWLLHRRRKQSD